MKPITICLALFCCVFARSQAVKDTLFFSNGSMIIGELEKVKLGVVTFDPDDANDIDVELRKLKTITARKKILRIETVDQHVYYGRILAHLGRNTIYIATLLDTLAIDLENIALLYAFEKSIKQRFSGSVGLGYTYTKSSGFGRLNFDGQVTYTARKTELKLGASGIYTLYDSLASREKEDISLKYSHFFIRNWFMTAFLAYQRNIELGLQRRYQQGFGLGNKFITSRQVYTWARGGFVINQEKSTEGVSSGVLSELFGQLELNFFRFENPKIKLRLAETFYYGISQNGRFRNDGSMNITWEIFKDFDFSLEPYLNYDSKPPATEGKDFDFGVVFGINYSF